METHSKLSDWYSDDHRRLDALLNAATSARVPALESALKQLADFQAGLEQHMAWEEAFLFPAFDERFPVAADEGITEALCSEHSEIRDVLAALTAGWREHRDTAREEARLRALLGSHNELEESRVYSELDAALSATERQSIFRDMDDSSFL